MHSNADVNTVHVATDVHMIVVSLVCRTSCIASVGSSMSERTVQLLTGYSITAGCVPGSPGPLGDPRDSALTVNLGEFL